MCSETKLEEFIEIIVGYVLMELCGHCSFYAFVKEGKVRDWWIIVMILRFQTSFLRMGVTEKSWSGAGGYHS